MTTILISILSGILGLIVGFAIGINSLCPSAKSFGDWKIYTDKEDDEYYTFIGNKDGDEIEIQLRKNGSYKLTHKPIIDD